MGHDALHDRGSGRRIKGTDARGARRANVEARSGKAIPSGRQFMNGRMLKGAWALSLSAALCACGGEEELVNPVPGTTLELLTPDGLNHGPVMEVTLENAASLSVPVGEVINIKAMGVFEDGYMVDVTEHTYFQVSGDISISARTDDGIPTMGTAEGMGEVLLILGSLEQPTIAVEVLPPLLKNLAIVGGADTLERRSNTALFVFGSYGDGSQPDLTADATWTSSDPTIATVDDNGVVEALKVGSVEISAAFEDQTTTKNFDVICTYPVDAPNLLFPDQSFPRISWSDAVFPAATPQGPVSMGPLSSEDIFCGENDLDGYNGILLQISAEWCNPCRSARELFSANRAIFEANGILPIFSEIRDARDAPNNSGEAANISMARELPADFGIRIGDTSGNILNQSPWLRAFPTLVVIRTSDMKVVATSITQYSEFFQVYPDIFANLDWNWNDLDNPIP